MSTAKDGPESLPGKFATFEPIPPSGIGPEILGRLYAWKICVFSFLEQKGCICGREGSLRREIYAIESVAGASTYRFPGHSLR